VAEAAGGTLTMRNFNMMSGRKTVLAVALISAIVALGIGQAVLDNSAEAAAAQQVQAPMFEVDPFWPKPLPNHWVIGNAIGVGVDSRDHVFIVHRSNLINPRETGASGSAPTSECCVAAPPVLEFDPEGNLVASWGGPGTGYTWPGSNHGINIDHKQNVWIGGNDPGDSHILKFTRDGKFLMEIGKPGQQPNSNDSTHFGRVAKISFDAAANEAYVADGYGNRRVAVLDIDTGKLKRYWGGYGEKPHDQPLTPYNPDSALIRSFRTPVHCADPSVDGLVYVCDRPNNRIQVFQKNGTFVKEVRIAPRTLGDGAVWDVAFSRDPQQKYLYLADGKNERVYVMDRQSLQILTQFGDGGRQPGQFFAVHSIVTDSKGNIYTTETYEGRRLQKFRYKGLGPVTKMNQGVVWPDSALRVPPR
jgi:DNA-binding beta-propeller fold protein YncE